MRYQYDNQPRDIRADSLVDVAVNKVKNRIPIVSRSLPEKVSTTGETITYGKPTIRSSFLDPAFHGTINRTKGEKLLYDLRDRSGGIVTQFYQTYTRKTLPLYGKKINLSVRDRAQIQKYVGREAVRRIESYAKQKSVWTNPPEDGIKHITKNILPIAKSLGERKFLNSLSSEQKRRKIKEWEKQQQ